MSVELERRVRAAVRDLAGAVPVVPPPPAAVRARVRHRGAGGRTRYRAARWAAPALAAAAVLALIAVVAVVPGWFGPPATSGPAGTDGRPVLPERFAGASWRTASVADSPPGPAIATYTQWVQRNEVLVVVGVDGRTYRRLDLAGLLDLSHNRGHSARDPVLSPDGSKLAGSGGYLIDLATGEGVWFQLLDSDRRAAWSPLPLFGWSPDSRLLAYSHRDGILVYDVATGDTNLLAMGQPGGGFAFSPDGQELAVATDPGGTIAVVDRSGRRLRELDLLQPGQWLAGHGTAWSPDGSRLVVHTSANGLGVVDATGAPAELAWEVSWDHASRVELLGWRGPGGMLVGVWSDGADGRGSQTTIVEVNTDSVIERSWLPDQGEPVVARLHLASGLLADAEIRDTGRPGQPLPALVGTGAALLAGAVLLVLAVTSWRRRRSRVVAA